jgi:membrane-bound ClpP family serine protease
MLNGVEGMVGDTATVTREVGPRHNPGTVWARGESWLAISMVPGTKIEPDTTVVIAAVEQGLLVVYPIEES